MAGAGQAGARARGRGDQGRRRRGLLHPRRRAARRRAHRGAGGVGARRPSPASSLQRALDEVHPGSGVLFGRSGWTGQHAIGHTWAGDQASDFWSLRVLVVATLSAACSGYLELVARRRRLPRPSAGRALPARAARALGPVRLLHAADARPRPDAAGAVALLASGCSSCTAPTCCCTSSSSRTCARRPPPRRAPGCPIIRPLCLIDPGDPRGWAIADAYGYGPSLWVAPVLDDGAREREVALPRGRVDRDVVGRAGSAAAAEVVVEAPLAADPGVGARGLDRRHLPGRARGARARGRRRSPSGRWSRRCGAGRGCGARARAARRRDADQLAPRRVVGLARARRSEFRGALRGRSCGARARGYDGAGQRRPGFAQPDPGCSRRRSGRGAHQLSAPSSSISDGTSSARMIDASISTASAAPIPSSLMNTICEVAERADRDREQQRRGGDDPPGPLEPDRDRLASSARRRRAPP